MLVVVFVGGTAAAHFGKYGYYDLRRSQLEQQALQRDVDEQLERLLELRDEVRALEDDPRAVERIAREDFGFIRRGEIHFLLPYEPPAATP